MGTQPGDVVKSTRERAGLTQRQLAERSGVMQPNIAAIETGRTRPTEDTLRRLLDAARSRPSLILERHREQVIELVRSHRGHDPRVFGSVARGTDTTDSDVDLLVRFEPGTGLLEVSALVLELEQLLGVDVDVVGEDSHGPTMQRALAEAVPV